MLPTRESDEYLTPKAVADLAKKTLGAIYFDPYGHPRQNVKVQTMHTIATGNQPWPAHGPWWVNPPFSQSGEQVPRISEWVSKHGIDCLMLCLAAPGSMYWRDSIWAKTGPQRIAWMPRLSFDQLDERKELTQYRRADTGRLVSQTTYNKLVRDQKQELLEKIVIEIVPNPNYGTVAKTDQSISRDLALMLWSRNPVVISRFVREVGNYSTELDPEAPPIGISLGGGA